MGDASHKVSPSKLILSLLQGERNEVLVVLLYGVGVSVLSLAVPVGIQTLVNTVTFGSFSQPVLFLVIAVFVGLTIAAVLRGIQIVVVEQLQRRFFTQIALELSYRIPRFSLERVSRSQFPELINRFFDVLTVQKSSAILLMEGFALALQITFGLILLAFYHWFLLAFAFVLISSVGIVIFLLGRGAVSTSIDESVQKYRVAAWLEELAARPLLFKSSASRTLALERANEIVSGYLEARSAHFSILMRQVVGSLTLQAVGSSALLGIGAYLVIKNQLTLGQLVAAEIVVTSALGSLAKFQKHLEAFYDLVAALDKIEGLLGLPVESEKGEVPISKKGPAEIEIREINYRFENGEPLFDKLDFTAKPGAKIAILGSNSSGKTTLIDLLYGIKTPQSGTLLLDGQDYRDLSPEALRDQVHLVRGIELLPDSVFENIRVGNKDMRIEKAREALSKVGLLDEVLKFPEGIHTKLGTTSPLTLSQAHAVIIARAIAVEPRVILVDETFDELDEKAREAALEVLISPSAPWTLILTTHDESLASRFSEILSLDTLRERKRA